MVDGKSKEVILMTDKERQEKLKNIEPFKTYDEYTEEEKMILPPLPKCAKEVMKYDTYIWDGISWGISYRGW